MVLRSTEQLPNIIIGSQHFVERMNRTVAERLYKIQDAQELNNPKEDSKIWVKHLQNIIKKMNSEITRMIKLKTERCNKIRSCRIKGERDTGK